MPTACRPQALDTNASTIFTTCERHTSSSSRRTLESLASGKLFELDLKVHDVLLARAISRRARIQSEATRLIEVPLGTLSIRESRAPADHCAGASDLVNGD